VPIRFSGGMDRKLCEEYHRYLDQEDIRREKKKAKKGKMKKKIADLATAFRHSTISSAARRRSSSSFNSIRSSFSSSRRSSIYSRCSTDGTWDEEENKPNCRYVVQFSDDVTVYPTPHQSNYPPSVHSSIWPNADEFSQNIFRNKLEFAYDKFNWIEATEEGGMVSQAEILKMMTAAEASKNPKKQQSKKTNCECEQQHKELLEQELVHPAHVSCLKKGDFSGYISIDSPIPKLNHALTA